MAKGHRREVTVRVEPGVVELTGHPAAWMHDGGYRQQLGRVHACAGKRMVTLTLRQLQQLVHDVYRRGCMAGASRARNELCEGFEAACRKLYADGLVGMRTVEFKQPPVIGD